MRRPRAGGDDRHLALAGRGEHRVVIRAVERQVPARRLGDRPRAAPVGLQVGTLRDLVGDGIAAHVLDRVQDPRVPPGRGDEDAAGHADRAALVRPVLDFPFGEEERLGLGGVLDGPRAPVDRTARVAQGPALTRRTAEPRVAGHEVGHAVGAREVEGQGHERVDPEEEGLGLAGHDRDRLLGDPERGQADHDRSGRHVGEDRVAVGAGHRLGRPGDPAVRAEAHAHPGKGRPVVLPLDPHVDRTLLRTVEEPDLGRSLQVRDHRDGSPAGPVAHRVPRLDDDVALRDFVESESPVVLGGGAPLDTAVTDERDHGSGHPRRPVLAVDRPRDVSEGRDREVDDGLPLLGGEAGERFGRAQARQSFGAGDRLLVAPVSLGEVRDEQPALPPRGRGRPARPGRRATSTSPRIRPRARTRRRPRRLRRRRRSPRRWAAARPRRCRPVRAAGPRPRSR